MLSTLFKCHNETFNVWSHLLGKLMFLSIAIVIFAKFRNIESIAIPGLSSFAEWQEKNPNASTDQFVESKTGEIKEEINLNSAREAVLVSDIVGPEIE